ncbi:MAG: type 1 glutamine amidotransferase [Actinomycetota bacterium]
MKPLLAVRHQASAHLGVTADALRAEGVAYRYLDAWCADEWPDPRAFSGLVVLGGEMNTDQYGDYPWLEQVRHLVEEAVDADMPVLGICLGAQTLARALGAQVRPATVKEVGFRDIAPTPAARADPVVASFAHGIKVFQWHEDAIELPDDATLLFSSTDIANQAFRAGKAYGVQFHFEVDEGVIADWCDESDPKALRDDWGVTKEGLLEEARRHLPAQRASARETVRAFARLLGG